MVKAIQVINKRAITSVRRRPIRSADSGIFQDAFYFIYKRESVATFPSIA